MATIVPKIVLDIVLELNIALLKTGHVYVLENKAKTAQNVSISKYIHVYL